jgi:hypothetical protein
VFKPENLKAVIAIVFLSAAGFACKSTSEPHTIKSQDGKYEFTVPGSMSESPGLNKDAKLTAASKANELYIFVLAKEKSEYAGNPTLDNHTDILRKALLDELKDGDASSPEKVTVKVSRLRSARRREAGLLHDHRGNRRSFSSHLGLDRRVQSRRERSHPLSNCRQLPDKSIVPAFAFSTPRTDVGQGTGSV